MPLPEWFTEPPAEPPGPSRGNSSWVSGAAKRLAALTAPRKHRSGIARIDARAAILGFVALIICATVLRSVTGLVTCWALSVGLALAVGAGAKTIIAASTAVGTLTAAAMLPATLAAVTPGAPVAHIGGVTFTDTGVRLLVVVVMRSVACLILGIALFSSNQPEELFAALRWFRAPGVFVAILLVTYRYIHVIARTAHEVHIARKSRVPQEVNLSGARRWLGERIGSLFARSRKLGEEVHLAMLARGFDGEWLPRPGSPMRSVDFAWISACLIAAILLILIDAGAPC